MGSTLRGDPMQPDHVYKSVELTGSSTTTVDDAVRGFVGSK